MALSRELIRRLEFEDEPLAKRLKLAENALTSSELAISRKEDLILKWLCRVLEKSTEEDRIIWSTLNRCLKLKNLTSDMRVLTTEIKESLIVILMKKLSGICQDKLNDVFQCCELVFTSCEMQQYFQSKPSCLAELITALVKSVYSQSKNEKIRKDCFISGNTLISQNANQDGLSGRKCAASAVECFVTCYKHSLSKDEFADLFLREMLYSLCSVIDRTGSDKLGAEIHKCIQQLIFGKSRYSQFKGFDGEEKENFPRNVFAELKKKTETAEKEISLVVFLYVFRAAVGSYKNDPRVIDIIMRNLIDSAGRVKIELLGCLREQLVNITFDYQNKIEDLTLLEFLQKLIDEILLAERLGSADFDALAVIAVLNPLIIEKKLQEILMKILLEKKETIQQRDSYRNLIISILNAEIRLRREHKLIPWILTAIKQTLDEREKSDLEISAVFPREFKDEFTKAVVNMTSTQMIGVFRSLTFHLNTLCDESTESSKNTLTFMLQANIDLMAAFFSGVRIFEHSVALYVKEKFAQALGDLGKTLGLLTERVLKTKRKKKRMITALLRITWYWDNMYNWLKYYAPDVTLKALNFPISQTQMQSLVQSIDDSQNKRAMNRILLQQMRRNFNESKSLDVSSLLDGFEKSWSFIIDENPQLISLMDNSQVAELTSFLLEDIKISESIERLNTDSVQNDERLMKGIVCQIFADIASSVNQSTTKTIVEHVNVMNILDRGKASKVLKEIKKDFVKNQWKIINEESLSIVERSLKILLNLPLTHLSLDLRTLILLVVYAIKKESEQSTVISQLCTQIILDVLEKSDVDIMDYVDAGSLTRELPHNLGIQRAVESSLRKVSSWDILKALIKTSEIDDDSVVMLLECLEKTRSKSSLKNNQKELLRRAEEKLSKKLLAGVESEIKDHRQVKRLSLALSVITRDTEIPENLVILTKFTLERIFLSKDSQDVNLVAEGLKLVKAVLKKRSKFEMTQEVVEHVWPLVIKNPSKELVDSLLETTQAKPLNKILQLLHKQTISGLDESNETCFANALVVWHSVTNAPMNAAREKYRIAAILNILEALQVSKIRAESWSDVLGLVQSIFARHSHAIEKGIDVILMLAARSLREVGLSACENVLAICFHLIKLKTDFVVDRLPVVLALYRQLVRLVVRESRKNLDSSSERKLGCLALDIAKFTNNLMKLKKELARISPYVIADLVEMFSEGLIPSYVKGPLEDSVGHFLSICDNHAVSLLSRALPAATQEIFKKLYENYKQFHKYTGKI